MGVYVLLYPDSRNRPAVALLAPVPDSDAGAAAYMKAKLAPYASKTGPASIERYGNITLALVAFNKYLAAGRRDDSATFAERLVL